MMLLALAIGALVGVLACMTAQGLWADFGRDLLEAGRFVVAYCRNLFPTEEETEQHDAQLREELALIDRLEAQRERALQAIAEDWRVINGGRR